MKHIKTFEDSNTLPKIGSYVICLEHFDGIKPEFSDFLSNNIGVIVGLPGGERNYTTYQIKYENVPISISFLFFDGIRGFYLREIIDWSDNKEDLEHHIKANKYNL